VSPPRSDALLTTVVCVVSVGVVRGTHHVPPKTACCQNLCGCGLIFVVRASSNPEMGVEVKPSSCSSSMTNDDFLLLCCSVDCTAMLPSNRRRNLCIMSDNNRDNCADLRRMLDDSGDQEMEEEMGEEEEFVAALAAVAVLSAQSRNFKWQDKCLNWSDHLAKLQHTGEFGSTHQMSFEALAKLKRMLGGRIILDTAKSNNSARNASNHIHPELVMHIGLRWLAGGMHPDIRDAAGVSTSSVHRCRNVFVDAALDMEELAIMLPNAEDPEEMKEPADRLQRKSSSGVVHGCVGCIDGLLVQIEEPDVENPRAHCFRHCSCFGLMKGSDSGSLQQWALVRHRIPLPLMVSQPSNGQHHFHWVAASLETQLAVLGIGCQSHAADKARATMAMPSSTSTCPSCAFGLRWHLVDCQHSGGSSEDQSKEAWRMSARSLRLVHNSTTSKSPKTKRMVALLQQMKKKQKQLLPERRTWCQCFGRLQRGWCEWLSSSCARSSPARVRNLEIGKVQRGKRKEKRATGQTGD